MYPGKTNIPEERLYPCRILGTGAANPTKQAGPGVTVTRTGAGAYRFTFAKDPGTFVGLRGCDFGALTQSSVVGLNLVRSVWDSTNKTIDVLVAAPTKTGAVASSDPASIAAGAVGTATLTITGAVAGDTVMVHPRNLATGLVVQSYSVSGADTVTVRLYNPTAGAIDDVAQTYEYTLHKSTATDLAADQYLDVTFAFSATSVIA